MVISIEATVDAISRAVQEVELMAGCKVKEVCNFRNSLSVKTALIERGGGEGICLIKILAPLKGTDFLGSANQSP